jgi:hypothetical protein
MKKNYVKPLMEVVELQNQIAMLAGSGDSRVYESLQEDTVDEGW